MKTVVEPFRIKSVEPIRITTRAERERALEAAHYNLFGLRSRDVIIDLLTDSGTGAMSTWQWSALMVGDETYAGSESYYELEATVRDLMGFKHVVPVHQGRAAERILFQIMAEKGSVVPNNTHFDTTRANLEYLGVEALDLCPGYALDTESDDPFKGNMDTSKLRSLLEGVEPGRIPFGLLTVTNNSNGGQAVSLANIREVADLYHEFGVPFFLDAARFAENAYLIKTFEPGMQNVPLTDIVLQMFGAADGCLISAKKDGLVNIGGILAVNDDKLAQKVRDLLILTEGFPTYGGLAGRDLSVLAQGLREVLNTDYLAYRHASARYMANALHDLGVPTVRPCGLHAVYVDARKLLPHIPPVRLPGQALCCELYLIGGVRAVEIGTLMFGRHDPLTGEEHPASLDLVRLTLPRRVYTQSHFDWVIEAFGELVERAPSLRGFEISQQAEFLRAFTARLVPIAETRVDDYVGGSRESTPLSP